MSGIQLRKGQNILIVGAGVFGLSTALQLAREGYTNITVLDRSRPPVPDGSSVDISRIIRFDYSDSVYAVMAKEAYDLWLSGPEYKQSFNPHPFLLMSSGPTEDGSPTYLGGAMNTLQQLGMPINPLKTPQEAKQRFPAISGLSDMSDFEGYYNENAGWTDAAKAIARLRDDCASAGISFLHGSAGTVAGIQTQKDGKVIALKTETGDEVKADLFIMATGAWSDRLIDMNRNTLSTAQCVGYLKLTAEEMEKYNGLPIYINLSSGFFAFPPHKDTGYLKVAIHGYGYTNHLESESHGRSVSSPPIKAVNERHNFTPQDATNRLHEGISEVLPELQGREFEKTHVCWYTDTPSGDFIMDFHPQHENLFVATGGSGQYVADIFTWLCLSLTAASAFKFLPVLGKYVSGCLHKSLPSEMLEKWAYSRTENLDFARFDGDGSRAGPPRREFTQEEKESQESCVRWP